LIADVRSRRKICLRRRTSVAQRIAAGRPGNRGPDKSAGHCLSTSDGSVHRREIRTAFPGRSRQGQDMALPHVAAAGSLALGLAVGLLPPPAPSAVTSGATPSGGWRWPLAGNPVVARPFQPPAHPWSAGHRGVDLAAAPGATVLAAGDGVVSFAGYVAGVGVVAIRHPDGLRTTYEPVSPKVRIGLAVQAGEPIGRLLPGHGDCGPARWCLHWGLLRGTIYLDPLTLIHRGPVRLLPQTGAPVLAPAGQPTAGVARLRFDRQLVPQTAAPNPSRARRRGHLLVRDCVAVGSTAAAAVATALGWWRRRRVQAWLPGRWKLRWAAGTTGASRADLPASP
jgi:murein DD-endopeptidase MepM/ murein hydrolase activator NlpD